MMEQPVLGSCALCRLVRRGARIGLSSDLTLSRLATAMVRETLERLAREVPDSRDEVEPFGDRLVSVSRPGLDLEEELKGLRESGLRPLYLES